MMWSAPQVAIAFSAARNSSSPWETVPVRTAIFQLSLDAFSATASVAASTVAAGVASVAAGAGVCAPQAARAKTMTRASSIAIVFFIVLPPIFVFWVRTHVLSLRTCGHCIMRYPKMQRFFSHFSRGFQLSYICSKDRYPKPCSCAFYHISTRLINIFHDPLSFFIFRKTPKTHFPFQKTPFFHISPFLFRQIAHSPTGTHLYFIVYVPLSTARSHHRTD